MEVHHIRNPRRPEKFAMLLSRTELRQIRSLANAALRRDVVPSRLDAHCLFLNLSALDFSNINTKPILVSVAPKSKTERSRKP